MSRRIPTHKKLERTFIVNGRNEALDRQSSCCRYCYEPLTKKNVTADHRVPVVQGGSNLKHNIDALCRPCNMAKDHMSEAQFLKIIKNPPSGSTIYILLTFARRKIWIKTHKACKNISNIVGLEYDTPIGKIGKAASHERSKQQKANGGGDLPVGNHARSTNRIHRV